MKKSRRIVVNHGDSRRITTIRGESASLLDLVWFAWAIASAHAAVKRGGYARLAAVPVAPATDKNDALIRRGIMGLRRARAYSAIKGNCLSESLALLRWLRARGVAAEIKFGVRRSSGDPGIDAHAWVEYAGEKLNDFDPRVYAELQRPSEFSETGGDEQHVRPALDRKS